MSQWIKCSEKLPIAEQDVLVYQTQFFYRPSICMATFRDGLEDGCEPYFHLHLLGSGTMPPVPLNRALWMPLPEAPEDE